jgi:hypothetical protein
MLKPKKSFVDSDPFCAIDSGAALDQVRAD